MESVSSRQTAASSRPRGPRNGLRMYMQSIRQAAHAAVARNASPSPSKRMISFPRVVVQRKEDTGEETTVAPKKVETKVGQMHSPFLSSEPRTSRETTGLTIYARSSGRSAPGPISTSDEIEMYYASEKHVRATSKPYPVHDTRKELNQYKRVFFRRIPSRLARLAKSSDPGMMIQTTSTGTTSEDNNAAEMIKTPRRGSTKVVRLFQKYINNNSNNDNNSCSQLTKYWDSLKHPTQDESTAASIATTSDKLTGDIETQSEVANYKIDKEERKASISRARTEGAVSRAALANEALEGRHPTMSNSIGSAKTETSDSDDNIVYSWTNSGDLSKTSTRISIDRRILETFSLESREGESSCFASIGLFSNLNDGVGPLCLTDAKFISSVGDGKSVSSTNEKILTDQANLVFTPFHMMRGNSYMSGMMPAGGQECRMVIRKVKSEGAAPEMYNIELLPLHEYGKNIRCASSGSCYHEARSALSSGTFNGIAKNASSHSAGASMLRRSTDTSDAFTDIPGILSPFSPHDTMVDLACSSETTILKLTQSVDRHNFVCKRKSRRFAKKSCRLQNKSEADIENALSCTVRTASTADFSETFTDTCSESFWEEPRETVVIDTVTSRMEPNLEVQLVQSYSCDQMSKTGEAPKLQKSMSCDDNCQDGILSDDISDAFTWATDNDALLGLGLGSIWSKTSASILESASSFGDVQSEFKTVSMEMDVDLSQYRMRRPYQSSFPSLDEQIEVKLSDYDTHCGDTKISRECNNILATHPQN
eukprot:scaffold2310_cov164-Amphora_coffeaeformis.AAC.5